MNRGTWAGATSGASGISFLVMFACQAVAAVLGGWLARKFAYSVMLGAGAAMAVASAFLFRVLLSPAGLSEAAPADTAVAAQPARE